MGLIDVLFASPFRYFSDYENGQILSYPLYLSHFCCEDIDWKREDMDWICEDIDWKQEDMDWKWEGMDYKQEDIEWKRKDMDWKLI